jgi:hypothetical protein
VDREQPLQIRRLSRVLLISALFFSCLSCRVTSERFIVRTYRAESPCVTITLVVNRDHSFVQSVHTHAGEINQLSGSWSVDKSGVVTFKPFLDFLNDDHGRQLGYTSFSAEVMPRGITMGPVIVKCSDSGHRVDYIK